ncbi:MAG: hypothetical protein IH596_01875 [Bacteroidales bacterium]|nr:hypothetical protein [Bacteroidales bacterium]
MISLLILHSCKKEAASPLPDIAFKTDSGFVFQETTLPIGQTILVGISANGDETNITFFHVGWDNGQAQTLLDSGMNQSTFSYDLSITKTASVVETWEFLVMNRNRQFNSVKLILHRDSSSQYGSIQTIHDLVLGAQAYPDAGSFFSLTAKTRYFLDEAFQHQDSVDMIYYFDIYDATFSSPAESDAPALFTGPTGLANWTIKNETRYDTTEIAPADFDLSLNDSLILAAYEPINLKRKAKYIEPGMVISFQDPRGKLGLIHVKEVVPGPAGYVLIDLKVQQ